jgi:hypothetical protein
MVRCSPATVLMVVIGTLFTVGGNAGQLISLNFWLGAFVQGGGPFTVLTVVAITVTITYGLALIGWAVARRPALRFVVTPEALILVASCGVCYSLNGVLLVYATNPSVPEIMQAILISTGVFWTCFAAAMAELIQNGRASLKQIDRWVTLAVLAFCLCVAGVIVGAGSYDLGEMSAKSKKWTSVYALAQVPGGVYNVIAARFMMRFSRHGVTSSHAAPDAKGLTSDNTTVKLVLLVGSSLVQAICLFCYFPLDWTQGYGDSGGRDISVTNLREGYQCVFFSGCPSTNFWYYFAFALSYALTMVGLAMLNHFSAPMCSMVQQLSSPAVAILLILFPALNATHAAYQLGYAIGSLVLLVVGSLLYVYWAQYKRGAAVRAAAASGEDENLIHDGNAYYATDEFGGAPSKHGLINSRDRL